MRAVRSARSFSLAATSKRVPQMGETLDHRIQTTPQLRVHCALQKEKARGADFRDKDSKRGKGEATGGFWQRQTSMREPSFTRALCQGKRTPCRSPGGTTRK